MRHLWGLLLFAAALPAQTIEGVVVNSVTKAGIPGAHVTVTPAVPVAGRGAALSSNTVITQSLTPTQLVRNFDFNTDLDGRFRLTGLDDGKYRLNAQVDGFLPGSRRDDPPVEIHAGDDPVKIQLELTPLATVSGRILDGKGRPASNAHVFFAAAAQTPAGERIITTSAGIVNYSPTGTPIGAVCDDDGNYSVRIAGQGNYTVQATPTRDMAPPDAVDDQEMGWAPTYYPGLTTREGAATIPIYPGAVVPDLNIKLLAVKVHHVRGALVDEKGQPVAEVTVTLGSELAFTDEEGKFDCVIRDGSWNLSAQKQTETGYQRADDTIAVNGHDIDNLKLHMISSFSIDGVVRFDPPLPAEVPLEPVLISMNSASPNVPGRSSRSDEKGIFTLDSVLPGSYTFNSSSAPVYKDPVTGQSEYYAASMRLGGREVLGTEPVHLVAATKLEVTFRRATGTLAGAVEGCAQGMVVAMPRQTGLRGPAKSAPCDGSRRYQITGLHPGEYDVLAVNYNPNDPNFPSQEDINSQTLHVTIRNGETTTQDVKVVRASK